MAIQELRILPPLAVARLGAASEPLDAYDLHVSEDRPLDYRRIEPQTTLKVDPASGEIVDEYLPKHIHFRDENRLIRPVAPFLQVFAVTDEDPGELVPLNLDLLAKEKLDVGCLSWTVHVGNIKVFRRTGDPNDRIIAKIEALSGHGRQPLIGHCPNFLAGSSLPLGWAQFIKPTPRYPEIRLRYTPAAGWVYGASLKRLSDGSKEDDDQVFKGYPERVIYDIQKGRWRGYKEGTPKPDLTIPGAIFAGFNQTDPKNSDVTYQVSYGYIDDECDGYVEVALTKGNQSRLTAQARIGAGPPTFAPDALPVRVVSDELEQLLDGPQGDDGAVPMDEALELIRRALDSVRPLNTAVMNANPVNGRLDIASTMARQDAADFSRMFESIAAPSLVDNLAVRALHERIYSALSSGSAPWFSEVLRRPDQIGDLSDQGRRKMPAMMRGADGRMLTLTLRQINQVIRAAITPLPSAPKVSGPQGKTHE